VAECCSTRGMDRFFSRFAGRYARRFKRRGPDKPSGILIRELTRLGCKGKTVLDIGCGAGAVHLTLLKNGALKAQAVEISAGMLEEARTLSGELGLSDRVSYIAGDVVKRADTIERSDIVVMDKVVCCYADPVSLIETAASRTGDVLALSFPSDSLAASVSFRFMSRLGRLLGWSFHPFYHTPSWIIDSVKKSSFKEVFSAQTVIWQTMVFRRDG